MIKVKPVYAPADPSDGRRFLVDRVWPRGIRRQPAEVEAWLKDAGVASERGLGSVPPEPLVPLFGLTQLARMNRATERQAHERLVARVLLPRPSCADPCRCLELFEVFQGRGEAAPYRSCGFRRRPGVVSWARSRRTTNNLWAIDGAYRPSREHPPLPGSPPARP